MNEPGRQKLIGRWYKLCRQAQHAKLYSMTVLAFVPTDLIRTEKNNFALNQVQEKSFTE